MTKARAAETQKRTRIQREKQDQILEAALDVFANNGFRGSTLDQIAEAAGLSKPNLLYYFRSKEDIHRRLLAGMLNIWLDPLREMQSDGNPLTEIQSYIRKKMEMARDFPRESRLYANEILRGGPHISEELPGLKELVDEKVAVIRNWIKQGRLAKCDPYHLLFSIWATTQHYADFDVQVCAVLGDAGKGAGRFEDAARFLDQLYVSGLNPKPNTK